MPQIGLIIIGDEILSGKRQDKHLSHVIEALSMRGLELAWCRIIGDKPAQIIETLQQTMATGDIVFSCGGVGATPDDHTRRCAATAANVPLTRHPGAVAEIEAQFGESAYPTRILMADLPQGASLIPNPYNRIPGFKMGHHHFLPGFPMMAWPMLEWVLDTHYPKLARTRPEASATLTVRNTVESELMPLMQAITTTYPDLRFASLPHIGAEGKWVELSVQGKAGQVHAARETMLAQLNELGLTAL